MSRIHFFTPKSSGSLAVSMGGSGGGGGGAPVPYNPLTDWTTPPLHGVWASDPLWVPPADGGAVSSWRNGGSAHTSGAYIGADGLVCPGTTTVVRSDCATIPDVAAMRPTGDMELVVYATATDWTPAAIKVLAINGLNDAAANVNWYLYLNTDGTVTFARHSGANARSYTSSAATGITDGTPKYVRVLFDQDNGAAASEVTFWLSDDGSTWTQLGTAVTNANTGAGNSNTTGITIGNASFLSVPWAGTIHRVQVWSGLTRAAATVLDVGFDAATEGISAFTESSSNAATVTIVSSQNPSQATGSKQPTYRASTAAYNNQPTVQSDGTDDFLRVAFSALTQPLWIVLVANYGNTTTANKYLCDGGATGRCILYNDASTTHRFFAGTALDTGVAFTADPRLHVVKFNGASSTYTLDGTLVKTGNTGTNGLDGATLFSNSSGSAAFNGGHIAYYAIFGADPTAQPEWAAFKAWVTDTYGITVAP